MKLSSFNKYIPFKIILFMVKEISTSDIFLGVEYLEYRSFCNLASWIHIDDTCRFVLREWYDGSHCGVKPPDSLVPPLSILWAFHGHSNI